MVKKIKNSFTKFGKKVGSFEYKNLLYISVFILVVLYFWRSILELFKPAADSKKQSETVTSINNQYKNNNSITADGYFLTGQGLKTKYNVTGARRDAESLSALLNTYKSAKWYNITISLFGLGSISRIKFILNPNYPASYRRYVIQTYKDVYTNYRDLQTDVRNALTGFAGTSYWTVELTKYFTL